MVLPVDILTGFLDDEGNALGRPVGVVVDKEGALLVADDVGNVVWRVTPAGREALWLLTVRCTELRQRELSMSKGRSAEHEAAHARFQQSSRQMEATAVELVDAGRALFTGTSAEMAAATCRCSAWATRCASSAATGPGSASRAY
jgi:hypothetical protein